MPQSRICLAPCVPSQCTSPLPPLQYTCKGLPKSSLHENVVFSICARMGNATHIISIMWNSISSLDACYHFPFSLVQYSRVAGTLSQSSCYYYKPHTTLSTTLYSTELHLSQFWGHRLNNLFFYFSSPCSC